MKAILSLSTKRAYCFYNSEDIYTVFHVTTLNNHSPESRVLAKIRKKLLSNAHPSIRKSFRTNVLLMSIIHQIGCLGIKPPTSSTLSTDFKMNPCPHPPRTVQKQSLPLQAAPSAARSPLPLFLPSLSDCLGKPSLTHPLTTQGRGDHSGLPLTSVYRMWYYNHSFVCLSSLLDH